MNRQEGVREAVRRAVHTGAEQAELPHVPYLRRPWQGLQGQEPRGLRRGPGKFFSAVVSFTSVTLDFTTGRRFEG